MAINTVGLASSHEPRRCTMQKLMIAGRLKNADSRKIIYEFESLLQAVKWIFTQSILFQARFFSLNSGVRLRTEFLLRKLNLSKIWMILGPRSSLAIGQIESCDTSVTALYVEEVNKSACTSRLARNFDNSIFSATLWTFGLLDLLSSFACCGHLVWANLALFRSLRSTLFVLKLLEFHEELPW